MKAFREKVNEILSLIPHDVRPKCDRLFRLFPRHGLLYLVVGADDVRVMTRKIMDDPGKPSGIVLSAATSFWLPIPPKQVFSFLRDENSRSELAVINPLAIHINLVFLLIRSTYLNLPTNQPYKQLGPGMPANDSDSGAQNATNDTWDVELEFETDQESKFREISVDNNEPQDDCLLLGLDPKYACPDWMILQVLPIPPTPVRSSVMMDTLTRCEVYISPVIVPVQYGGLSHEVEHEFSAIDFVTEEIIKPVTKHEFLTEYASDKRSLKGYFSSNDLFNRDIELNNGSKSDASMKCADYRYSDMSREIITLASVHRPLRGDNQFDVKLFHLHFCITIRVLIFNEMCRLSRFMNEGVNQTSWPIYDLANATFINGSKSDASMKCADYRYSDMSREIITLASVHRPLRGDNQFDVKLFHLHFCITIRVLIFNEMCRLSRFMNEGVNQTSWPIYDLANATFM
ncbi:homeobox-leucine zipper protein MERISTEM L1 [Artemisia annua]|uniref:Homeobox-leucine zipper protein MERISTEM L1 n=1 Tax=Artemisia annua TaxID=35608 RepID=A0A2U1MWA6_ARTAN|nr:homeobox-leucine zipper protein MERISTEM L1 [Artemisia annua]